MKTWLNIGGGNFHEDGWLNLDYPFEARSKKQRPGLIDIEHNLMTCDDFPIPSGVMEAVYTEHCIEHIVHRAAQKMFREVHRILKPGHSFRISCPDADIAWDSYTGDGKMLRLWAGKRDLTPLDAFLDVIASPKIGTYSQNDIVVRQTLFGTRTHVFAAATGSLQLMTVEDQLRKPGHHINWWNFDRLKDELELAGFRKVKRKGVRESKVKCFKRSYIDRTMPNHSLRVEGVK